MKTERRRADEEIARAFLAHARQLLAADYLPRIERCLAALAPGDVWWSAGPSANSIGNLLQHLAGNARQWIVAGVGGAPDVRHRDEEFARPAAAPPTSGATTSPTAPTRRACAAATRTCWPPRSSCARAR
jgi:hypothetical protein